jgi:hypothetical protein
VRRRPTSECTQKGTLAIPTPAVHSYGVPHLFSGNTYLFAYDVKANVLLNAAFPKREGTNVAGGKGAKGKLFHDELANCPTPASCAWSLSPRCSRPR